MLQPRIGICCSVFTLPAINIDIGNADLNIGLLQQKWNTFWMLDNTDAV